MKNTRFFLTAVLMGLLFMACSDDDQAPTPGISISISETTFGEGDGTAVVTFSTTDAFAIDVTLSYEVSGTAVSGEDYTALPGTIVLGAGQNSVTENIVFTDDNALEEDETIIITLTAVDGGPDFISLDNAISLTIIDNDDPPFDDGILVVHEGGFFMGNASVSFISNDLSTATNGIYSDVNGEPLGDIAQSIAFDGDLAYIVVNNSQKIEVVNRFTFESVATIDSGLLNPRYMVFADGKGYVSNWGDGLVTDDDYIAIIDLENNTVESTIAVPEGPEEIVVSGNTIYVAHKGGFGQNNILSAIDVTTGSIETITVGDVPSAMQFDVNGNLWVLCSGIPAFTGNETGGSLFVVDTMDNAVVDSFDFATTEHPDHLSLVEGTLYYFLAGEVYAEDVSGFSTLPQSPIISNVSFYDMTVNDGLLYGTDAKDFASDGDLVIYNLSDNTLVDTITLSIVPSEVYFNDVAPFEN
ncbi:MAG: DUF5074 domain-containing protein [Bacteroidota bacterium]